MSPPNVRGTIEEKNARFKAIIKNGRDLFVHESEKGFTTKELASRVNLKQASLYKYIENKRDLWFAIVIHDLEEMVEYFKKIIDYFTGSAISLLSHIVERYFDYAIANQEKFHLLYRISPPNSNSQNPGPFERQYYPAKYYAFLIHVVEAALNEKQIKVSNPTFFTFYVFSILHGATLLVGERGFTHNPIEFKDYVMDQFNHLLRSYKPDSVN